MLLLDAELLEVFREPQSGSVHVWMLFCVSSVLSSRVRVDLPSSGPCSLSVSLSLRLCAHSSLICLHNLSVSLLTCLHSYRSLHSSSLACLPPPLPPFNSLHTLTWFQRSAQREAVCLLKGCVYLGQSAFLPHFLHDCFAPGVYVRVTQ